MCIFCEIANGNIPSKKVYEDEYTLAFLDLSQTTKGHTLVIPKQHVASIEEVDLDTLNHVNATVLKVIPLLKEKCHCLGFNVLTNANEVAGQTVPHFHVHIIPRYDQNDTIKIDFSENKYDLDDILHTIID